MGAFTSQAPVAVPLSAVPVAASAQPTAGMIDPYQESVLRAQSREAEVAAALAAQERALLAEQKQGDRAAQEAAAIEGQRIEGRTQAAEAARRAALQGDQGASRASAAARGILSGGTARTLLDGLERDAAADIAAGRQDAAQRLEDIRRGLEIRREENLLALAEQRRRAQLALHGAASDTAFAQREAWLRQTSDQQRAYERDLEAYTRQRTQQAQQASSQRSALIDSVTGTTLGILMPRLR